MGEPGRYRVSGQWGPGGSDRDVFLRLVEELAPDVLNTLAEKVRPSYVDALRSCEDVRRHPKRWTAADLRKVSRLRPLYEALVDWARPWELTDDVILDVALYTLWSWHQYPAAPNRWVISKRQWQWLPAQRTPEKPEPDPDRPDVTPKTYTFLFTLQWSPLHSLDKEAIIADFAAWLDRIESKAVEDAGKLVKSGGLESIREKRPQRPKSAPDRDEYEHFRWAIRYRCLKEKQRDIAASVSVTPRSVRDAIRDVDSRLGLTPVNGRARPRNYKGRNRG